MGRRHIGHGNGPLLAHHNLFPQPQTAHLQQQRFNKPAQRTLGGVGPQAASGHLTQIVHQQLGGPNWEVVRRGQVNRLQRLLGLQRQQAVAVRQAGGYFVQVRFEFGNMVFAHGQKRPHGRHFLGVVDDFVLALGLRVAPQQLAELHQEVFFDLPVRPVQREQFFELIEHQQRKPGASLGVFDQRQRAEVLCQRHPRQRFWRQAKRSVKAGLQRLQRRQNIVVDAGCAGTPCMVQANHRQRVQVLSDLRQQCRLDQRCLARSRG